MESGKTTRQTARRTLWTFAVASFLHDVGADMVYSVWPLYVRSVLGANMVLLGFIDGLGDAVVSLSQAVGGYLSDRIGKRKIFVMIGYSCGAVARIGYSFSSQWYHLVPWRVLDRSGKLRTSPRDAIVAEASPRKHRGGDFGILRLMDNLGSVGGVLLAIGLLSWLGYRKLFLVAAIPSLLAVALVTFFIPERRHAVPAQRVRIHFRDVDRNFLLFLITSAIFALGSFSYSFLLITASTAGFRTTTIPMFYLLATFVAGIASIPFGRLSDRIGRKSVILISFFFWALTGVTFLFQESSPILCVLAFVLYGIHSGALDTVQRVFVSELAPKHFMASTLGGFQMVIGLMSLPASLIAGLLWEKVGPHAPFYLALTLTFVASVCMLFVREARQKSSGERE